MENNITEQTLRKKYIATTPEDVKYFVEIQRAQDYLNTLRIVNNALQVLTKQDVLLLAYFIIYKQSSTQTHSSDIRKIFCKDNNSTSQNCDRIVSKMKKIQLLQNSINQEDNKIDIVIHPALNKLDFFSEDPITLTINFLR